MQSRSRVRPPELHRPPASEPLPRRPRDLLSSSGQKHLGRHPRRRARPPPQLQTPRASKSRPRRVRRPLLRGFPAPEREKIPPGAHHLPHHPRTGAGGVFWSEFRGELPRQRHPRAHRVRPPVHRHRSPIGRLQNVQSHRAFYHRGEVQNPERRARVRPTGTGRARVEGRRERRTSDALDDSVGADAAMRHGKEHARVQRTNLSKPRAREGRVRSFRAGTGVSERDAAVEPGETTEQPRARRTQPVVHQERKVGLRRSTRRRTGTGDVQLLTRGRRNGRGTRIDNAATSRRVEPERAKREFERDATSSVNRQSRGYLRRAPLVEVDGCRVCCLTCHKYIHRRADAAAYDRFTSSSRACRRLRRRTRRRVSPTPPAPTPPPPVAFATYRSPSSPPAS